MLRSRIFLITGCFLIGFLFLCPSPAPGARTAKDLYFAAEGNYKKLRHNPQHQKYRDKWLALIKDFEAVYRHDPSGPWAAAGLYMTGTLYYELYTHSFAGRDKEMAVEILERVARDFPESRYRRRAEQFLSRIPDAPRTREDAPARADARETGSGGDHRVSLGSLATVQDLRYWSNPKYTRVVIDVDGETDYSYHLLKKDPSLKKPQRLYVDLKQSRLGQNIKKHIPINDDLLLDARAGQYRTDAVRVVVDLKSFQTYKIFTLKNPFRIVMDIWGENGAFTAGNPQPGNTGPNVGAGSLARQLALGVRTIVIDPGHGGRDYGAPGYIKGVHEKHITLQLARRLAGKVEKELSCRAILTRDGDNYLTLEERTAIANTQNADLFISIHTNASRDRRAYGIETYFLNLATDDESILVAARENATSTRNISDLQKILNDLMQNAKINESSRLATRVQHSLCTGVDNAYKTVRNKGVKQAPFYVLLGAQMPAVLVETSFISNPRECKRLMDPKYQEIICDSIIKGIRTYIREINPTALSEPGKNLKG